MIKITKKLEPKNFIKVSDVDWNKAKPGHYEGYFKAYKNSPEELCIIYVSEDKELTYKQHPTSLDAIFSHSTINNFSGMNLGMVSFWISTDVLK